MSAATVERLMCEVGGCDRTLTGRTGRLCYGHYKRRYVHGDVLADRPLGRHVRHRPQVRYNDPDIDEVAVDRALGGDRDVQLSEAEMAEVVARLTTAGLSGAQIGARLGVSSRTVVRWRSRVRAVG